MQEHQNLAAALAALQAELPKLRKDETAKVRGETKDGRAYDRSYTFAGLDQVVETVLPALGQHGLSVTSKTTMSTDGFMLEVKLLHISGEAEIGYWPLPDPRRAGPQDIGSAMTYGRRYLTLALTGTFPGGEDDEGAKAQAKAERWEDARPGVREAMDQHQRGVHREGAEQPQQKTAWTDEEVRGLHKRIETLPIGQAINGYDWMAGNNLHNRKVEISTDAGPLQVSATDVLAYRLADEAIKLDSTVKSIDGLRAWARDRGLLKIQVSESTTLDEELGMARDVRASSDAKAADEPVQDLKSQQ